MVFHHDYELEITMVRNKTLMMVHNKMLMDLTL